ncbi:MAG: NAD(P)/FAD-dependent oxidoreductase [Candidatus Aminicenantales bacterium]
MEEERRKKKIVIAGGGPAGLTAAYMSCQRGLVPLVFEKGKEVGGISKTVSYQDYLFDIGGHRFFTKYDEVKEVWDEILGEDFITRPRLSRIYYNGKFYNYPLRPLNALRNLGLLSSIEVLASYFFSQLCPYTQVTNFEEWVSNKFGKKLFRIFFKTYTEKVWGMPCTEIQADWAAQRIKSLSLLKAVLSAFGFLRKGQVTTLIDSFNYPRRGPGQMWNAAREKVQNKGGKVKLMAEVLRFNRNCNTINSLTVRNNGHVEVISGDYFLSSLPLKELILSLDPPPPPEVREAARGLRYRDFFSVNLIINKPFIFEDNWIYIHSPEVRVGRIQNFKNWSPEMVPDPKTTSLGLEYFCFDTDEIWNWEDKDILNLGIEEAEKLNFISKNDVIDGFVVRSAKTYPIYDRDYKERVEKIRCYLSSFTNLQTMGRNGLHRYNNQDHSMLSAMIAIGNVLGEEGSVWDINVDDEYHEIRIKKIGEGEK